MKTLALAGQLGMAARDRDVVEEDVALGRAPDEGAVADRLEALPRPAAAGADDERRPVDAVGRGVDLVRARGSPSSHRSCRARAAPRSARSTTPTRDSESRTRGSRCGSSAPAEDRPEIVRDRHDRRRASASSRSARMMSICACITRRLSEMSSSSFSSRRISAQSSSSSRLGEIERLELRLQRQVAGALEDRPLERGGRRRVKAPCRDLRLQARGSLGAEDVDAPVEDAAAAGDLLLRRPRSARAAPTARRPTSDWRSGSVSTGAFPSGLVVLSVAKSQPQLEALAPDRTISPRPPVPA